MQLEGNVEYQKRKGLGGYIAGRKGVIGINTQRKSFYWKNDWRATHYGIDERGVKMIRSWRVFAQRLVVSDFRQPSVAHALSRGANCRWASSLPLRSFSTKQKSSTHIDYRGKETAKGV